LLIAFITCLGNYIFYKNKKKISILQGATTNCTVTNGTTSHALETLLMDGLTDMV